MYLNALSHSTFFSLCFRFLARVQWLIRRCAELVQKYHRVSSLCRPLGSVNQDDRDACTQGELSGARREGGRGRLASGGVAAGRWIRAQQDPHVAGAAAEGRLAMGGSECGGVVRDYPDILPNCKDLAAAPLDPLLEANGEEERRGRRGG